MSTVIYYGDINSLLDDDFLYKCLSELSPYRRQRAEKLKRVEDKRLSVCATQLLDYALRQYGLREVNMTYLENEYGKPYFADYPDIHFSLSHSGEYAVCAVSDTDIGCDIEKIGRLDMSIAKRFFSEGEFNIVLSAEDNRKATALTEIWTAKESYIKAVGRGLSLPLSSFDINSITDYHFTHFYNIDGYIISICSKDRDVKITSFCC